MKIADLSLDKKKKKTRVGKDFQDTYYYVSLEDQFTDVVNKYPERIALHDEYGMMDFKELDRFSSNLARFILDLSNNKPIAVGIMCDRSRWFAASALAVLRAGAIYVPIDPSLPYTRKREMLVACDAKLLLIEHSTIPGAPYLVYDTPGLDHLICVDTEQFETAIESRTERMSRELWDQVSAERSDASWISMTTRERYSEEVIRSLADNVYEKVKSFLKPGSAVLDIGSGSGEVAKRIAGFSTKYTAIDLSSKELSRLEEQLGSSYPGLELDCFPYEAIDISILHENTYDLIVMNSVAENFPGLNYFRSVLDSAIHLLKPGGALFIGGILDPGKRDVLYEKLREFAQETGEIRGLLQLENRVDNYVPKAFFKDWTINAKIPVELEFSPSGIKEPELADYRYDLLIQKSEGINHKPIEKPVKYFYGNKVIAGDRKTVNLPSLPADQTAYIIFTSGSTGKPKGVVIQHDSLLNLADELNETVYQPVFKNEPQEIALVASFSFDASLQQLILNYTRGHTLTIVSDTMKREPGKLTELYKRRKIALSDMTPSLFSMYLDYLDDHQMSTEVKAFILGGERLELDLLDNFYRNTSHADTRIINAYGPTECCVDSTLYVFTRANFRQYDVPPIGSPVKNSVIEIRDAKGVLVPDSIPGELWIGGRGVAKGYLNDTFSTEKSFKVEKKNSSIKWYMTGDYGRKTKDGIFQFIGREDDQVKIGGYRIELGEVESAFRKCPLIKDGVINAVDISGNGTKVLIAYFIANGNTDVPAIKAFLQSVLPSHVIPSYYLQVEELPYTTSGKINRKKLPLPSSEKTKANSKSKPLTKETEKKLARLWQTLLGITIDDANADFFILGGHSVLAVRLMAMIEKEFGIRLPLSQLFKTSKIAELAGVVEEGNQGQETWNPLIVINENGELPPIFFFHPVGGNVLCYQQLASELENDRPVYMLESHGLGEGQPVFNSVEEKVAFYLKYMIEAVPEGSLCLAGWSFGGMLAFEAARQLQLRGRKVDALILLDTVAAKDKIRDLMQQDEAGFIYSMFGEVLELNLEDLRKSDSKSRIEFIVHRGMEKEIFPKDFDKEKMQVLLDVYMNNGLASAKYVFKPWDGEALLIRPETISSSALNVETDELQGWGPVLQKGIQLEWVKGTHETLLQEPYLKDVSRFVKAYLNKTSG